MKLVLHIQLTLLSIIDICLTKINDSPKPDQGNKIIFKICRISTRKWNKAEVRPLYELLFRLY